MTDLLAAPRRLRVVIIGSGFGGLFAAQALKRAPVDVTVIAATAHHLFQPLLYQVATGVLSPGEIAPATREVLRSNRNTQVRLGEVTRIDVERREVTSRLLDREFVTEYDTLIVAAGAGQSYFGNDQFAQYAPGMKSVDDALELRGRIFGTFELAELMNDPDEVRRLLTFVIVGAGPTGVELAGQISELSRRTLRKDFRNIDPRQARIVLVDAAPNVLAGFGDRLGEKAAQRLRRMGVQIRLGAMVTDVDTNGVTVRLQDGSTELIEAGCTVWAAGVAASPLARQLAQQTGAELDRAARIRVNPDLTLPGHPEVFVVGDMAAFEDLPGVAQVAIQGARHAARTIQARLRDRPVPERFRYHDKGSMATISRFSAVASIGRLRFSGFVAWLLWLVVHLVYIIGFKRRLTTLLHWIVSFVGRDRAERTATLQQVIARGAIQQLGPDYERSIETRPAGATAVDLRQTGRGPDPATPQPRTAGR